jgi:hypothetical protein
MALITVFMVLMVASALMVGFFATIIADQRANGIDRDQTQAYAAAHAALEKLTSDMATLFTVDYSPNKAQINLIKAKPPTIPGFSFIAPGGVAGSGYDVTFKADTNPANLGNPAPENATGTPITAGPYAGFNGIITKYPITVTARSSGGAEVRLRRELQTVAVPVFQFGVFSETDLTFYAGDNFNFGGRVQTNGSLFLAENSCCTLTMSDRVTAFREVVRNNLSNAIPVAAIGFTGVVNVLDVTSGIHYRPLATNEGSVTGMPSSPGPPPFVGTKNTNWTAISTGGAYYKSIIRNGLTGAKYLSLPLVSQGAQPIDLIRRPPVTPVDPALAEHLTNALVFGQRYFSLGYPDNGPSLRILLSDRAEEILRLPTVTVTPPVPLDGTHTAAQYAAPTNVGQHVSPLGTSPGYWNAGVVAPFPYRMTSTASAYAPPSASTVTIGAGIPAYFKIPLNIVVGGLNRVCTGRTATTFTGCLPTPAANIPAGTAVTAVVPSGAGTINVATALTASWNVGVANMTVASTSAFAPGVFWLSTAGALLDGGAFTCTGYTAANVLTGCSGLAGAVPNGTFVSTGSMENAGAALNNGFIKIEMRNNATPGAWEDVTTEILNLGISGPPNNGPVCDPTPNAVIRLQHLRDHDGGLCSTVGFVGNASLNSNDYWPNALYDTREGTLRDNDKLITDRRINHGGVMNYVALDVRNLTRWLAGAIGANGNRALSQNGYIVYFSDRRNNKCTPGVPAPNNSCLDIPALGPVGTPVETGEFGFEDFVNPGTADGIPVAPRVLDVGEDVNAFIPVAGQPAYVAAQDIYGITPPVAAVASFNNPLAPLPPGMKDALAFPWIGTNLQWVGMINRPVLFRRALKLVNGGSTAGPPFVTNLPAPGLTVASENPVYVQGNFNATVGTAAGVTAAETHNSAAILADAITLLSNIWNDAVSFQWPNDAARRPASTTAYRFAAVSGKSLSFPWAGIANNPTVLFGTDGGVGNFLRLLEDWIPGGTTIRYRGSIVSLFISRQATGTYKYNIPGRVYDFGLRTFTFDNDFLLPALLPPGTPMFRDVNTLTFRQLLRPNQ